VYPTHAILQAGDRLHNKSQLPKGFGIPLLPHSVRRVRLGGVFVKGRPRRQSESPTELSLGGELVALLPQIRFFHTASSNAEVTLAICRRLTGWCAILGVPGCGRIGYRNGRIMAKCPFAFEKRGLFNMMRSV
jgi:hypothetical protein